MPRNQTKLQAQRELRRKTGEYVALRAIEKLVGDEHRWTLARNIRRGMYPGLDPALDDCGVTLLSAYIGVTRDREPRTQQAVLERIRRAVEEVPWMSGVRCDVGRSWMDVYNNHPTTSHAGLCVLLERVIEGYLSG